MEGLPLQLDPCVGAPRSLVGRADVQLLQHQPLCTASKRFQQVGMQPALQAIRCLLLLQHPEHSHLSIYSPDMPS